MARDIRDVITQIKEFIPSSKPELLYDLDQIRSSADYAPPELLYLGWERLQNVLECGVSQIPEMDWEFQVASIVSTIPIETLREQVKEYLATLK